MNAEPNFLEAAQQPAALAAELVEPSTIELQERASIDVQIATARHYPRSLSQVKSKMLSFATLDQETAASCFYTLPPRRGGDGKPIQGPSVRLAEIALASYQHLRAGARVIANDGKNIVAQGVVHDLENNVCVSIERRRRITTKEGRQFSDDMQTVVANAACSIALRDATFRVVPLAIVKPVYEAAKKTAIGDAKTLATRRADCLSHFAKLGISKERVCSAISTRSVEDIGLEHIEILIGYANAIRDGESSIDEIFPAQPKEPAAPTFAGQSLGQPNAKQAPVDRPAEATEGATVAQAPKAEAAQERTTTQAAPAGKADSGNQDELDMELSPSMALKAKADAEGISPALLDDYARSKRLDLSKDADAQKILNAWSTVSRHIKQNSKF